MEGGSQPPSLKRRLLQKTANHIPFVSYKEVFKGKIYIYIFNIYIYIYIYIYINI